MSAPNCPTCGFVMCEGFDEERINDVATLATPNGEYSCCSGLCDETGGALRVCAVCGKSKCPRGRSAPLAEANSLCDWECPGYAQDPKPSELWPGEQRWQFGYPRVPPYKPSPQSDPKGVDRG